MGHQPASRSDGSTTERFYWDNAGRLSRRTRGPDTWLYLYDGLSQLRAVQRNGAFVLALERDVQGAVVRRTFGDPRVPNVPTDHALLGWESRANGDIIEPLGVDGQSLGFWENGLLRWVMPELGGGISAVVNDAGVLQSRVWRSAFGVTRARVGAQDAAELHGHEADLLGLHNAGTRHWMPELGMWLQPDPLLLMGPSGSLLEDPLRFHPYRYARNNPVGYTDPDGGVADVLVDAAFLAYDLYSVWDDPESGVNWAALNADLICAVLPGATGGGVAVRVAGHADEVMDGANAVGRMDGGVDEVVGALARAEPGAWEPVSEVMSARARAFQERVTGVSADSAYVVGGKKFDGYADGVLLEAKGEGYAQHLDEFGSPKSYMTGFKAMTDQLVAQGRIAEAAGVPLRWHVAEEPLARYLREFAKENKVTVEIIVTAP